VAALPGLITALAAAANFANHREHVAALSVARGLEEDYKRLRVAADISLLEAQVLGAFAALWFLVWGGLWLWRSRRRVNEMTASER